MPTDPVCGMFVPETTDLKLEKNGRTYYFCSRDCFEKFKSPEDQIRSLKARLAVAWVFSIPILLITYLFSVPHRDFVLLALDIPVQFYAGIGFYRGAWGSIKNRMGNMDILISLGTLTAFFYSLLITLDSGLLPGASVYFDASAFIITLILTGSFMESLTKKSAGDAAASLLQVMPRRAHLLSEGKIIDVDADSLRPSDIISVRAGEIIPADGIVVEGKSDLDTSALTGEEEPVTAGKGDAVAAGMRNLNGNIEVEVKNAGRDSTISKIYDMLQSASSGRAKIQKIADIFSTYFVPVVLISAVISAAFWAVYLRGNPLDAVIPVLAFVSVVVIACPCAIGLAAPMVMLIASSQASSRGVLFKNTSSLDRIDRATRIVFDKTGTITYPVPSVTEVESSLDRKEFLQLVCSLEEHSNHPVAKAVVVYCRSHGINALRAENVHEVPGSGITGEIEGKVVDISRSADSENSAIEVKMDGQTVGKISLSYRIREEMPLVLSQIREMGAKISVISGDRKNEVSRVAHLLGIEDYRWECTPESKASIIQEYQENGDYVVFVGDGINDAVAMETADASIAVSTASQIAMDAGDVILTRDNMMLVPEVMRIARISMRKIRQNIGWAVGYNSLLIPVAAGILVPVAGLGIYSFLPMLSALAMGFSSTSVVLNSLLMKRSFRTLFTGSTPVASVKSPQVR